MSRGHRPIYVPHCSTPTLPGIGARRALWRLAHPIARWQSDLTDSRRLGQKAPRANLDRTGATAPLDRIDFFRDRLGRVNMLRIAVASLGQAFAGAEPAMVIRC